MTLLRSATSKTAATTTTVTTVTSSTRPAARKVPWSAHTKKIILASVLVVIPMVAFTVTIISIVFVNSIDLNECPNPGLCPYAEGLGPANSSNYYVDFPVGRLTFASSLSSTISFALVAAMMSMYGYVVASKILRASNGNDGNASLPTPYGTSTLIRLLNAETFILWEIILLACRRIVRRKPRGQQKPSQEPSLLRWARNVLLLGLAASVLVQIADTYFHIVIEAISVTRLSLEPDAKHQLSRSLAPWALDTNDPTGEKSFYSPAMEIQNKSFQVANLTRYLSTVKAVDTYLLNYTDPEDHSYSLVKPPAVDRNLDWTGTGYGVSIQCSAIPRDSCRIDDTLPDGTTPFKCNSISPSINVNGTLGRVSHETWSYDWHQYLWETAPFYGNRTNGLVSMMISDDVNDTTIAKTTREDSNTLFQNPWRFLAKIQTLAHDSELPDAFLNSPLLHKEAYGSNTFLLACNSTVYDTEFTVVGDRVSSMTASKSNGSVAGMVSMPSLASVGKMELGRNNVVLDMAENRTTPEEFIRRYELSMSKQFSVPLIIHTVPAPAIAAQRRNLSVITRLPKEALWLLVVANLLFALMGYILAILAMKATSPEVHQVHVRLSTAGLAAQLFDPQHARREGNNDAELFREKHREEKVFTAKRIGVKRTAHGGAEFVTHETSDDASMEEGGGTLKLRHTHTM